MMVKSREMKTWQTPKQSNVAYPTPSRMSLNQFIRSLRLSGLVLDLGCGDVSYLSPMNHLRVVRVDIHANLGVEVVADAHQLPFGDGSFDVVLAIEMLEHLMEPWRAVEEIKRVVRPGGTCVLSTRFYYPIHGAPDDYFRFTEFGLRHLFAKWEILLLKSDTNLLASLVIFGEYAAEELSYHVLRRVVRKALWRPLRRLYLMLHALRLGRIKPSSVAPSGYHLVARKPLSGATLQVDGCAGRRWKRDGSCL